MTDAAMSGASGGIERWKLDLVCRFFGVQPGNVQHGKDGGGNERNVNFAKSESEDKILVEDDTGHDDKEVITKYVDTSPEQKETSTSGVKVRIEMKTGVASVLSLGTIDEGDKVDEDLYLLEDASKNDEDERNGKMVNSVERVKKAEETEIDLIDEVSNSMSIKLSKIIDVGDDSTEEEFDPNNNELKFYEKTSVEPYSEASEVAEEVINLILSSMSNSTKLVVGNHPVKNAALAFLLKDEDKTVPLIKNDNISENADPIDASDVAFSCQDVRLKPGFVAPVVMKKPKIIAEKKNRVDVFNNEVLAPPGQPVIIPDIAEESWMEATDEEFGQELAEKLKEEKGDMIISLVKTLGRKVVLNFFKETQKTEASGGLLIMNGARRRTSGGVFLQLLRVTQDPNIKDEVKTYFDQISHDKQMIKNRIKMAASIEKKKKLESGIKEFLLESRLETEDEEDTKDKSD